MRRIAALAALAALAGCGGSGPDAAAPAKAGSIVDPQGGSPPVNSLEVEPGSGALLVTTNRGFFRVAPGTPPQPVRATATASGQTAPVGTFLELLPTGRRTLLGSGHPDRRGALPEFLGVMRSEDDGRHWRVVSRLGEADLHAMALAHGRLYAYDAVRGAVLISGDGGRTFAEKPAPPEPMVELVVDPATPRRLLLASEQTLFRSEDGGGRWRPIARVAGARLAWPEAGRLYRAEQGGAVSVSSDGGDTFRAVGRIDGEPARLTAVDGERLYAALGDGAIVETRDGGRSWKAVYTP